MKSYPQSDSPWFRALRYPFLNKQRDFYPRIFNLEKAPDGQRVHFTTNVNLKHIDITPHPTLITNLLPSGDNRQIAPVKAYDIKCLTPFGLYEAKRRVPMLAIGSNSSDEQLNRKFKNAAYRNDMLILPAWLENYSVVYMPLITYYGSVPATLCRTPGISARVTVGFFTVEQARDIIGTESHYAVHRLHDKAIFDDGRSFDQALAFISGYGVLQNENGRPFQIAEVPHKTQTEQKTTVLNQYEIQNTVMRMIGDQSTSVTAFIQSHLGGQKKRLATTMDLKKRFARILDQQDHTTLTIKTMQDPEKNYTPY